MEIFSVNLGLFLNDICFWKKKQEKKTWFSKTYVISEKKKTTEPFFEKNNLGFFWNKRAFGEK